MPMCTAKLNKHNVHNVLRQRIPLWHHPYKGFPNPERGSLIMNKKAREGTPNRFRLVHLLHNVYHHPK